MNSGNDEVLPFSRLRPLDAKFKTRPPQAQEARLLFVKLVKPEADYGGESLDRFRDLAEGRNLMRVIAPPPLLPPSAPKERQTLTRIALLSVPTSTTKSRRFRTRCRTCG